MHKIDYCKLRKKEGGEYRRRGRGGEEVGGDEVGGEEVRGGGRSGREGKESNAICHARISPLRDTQISSRHARDMPHSPSLAGSKNH